MSRDLWYLNNRPTSHPQPPSATLPNPAAASPQTPRALFQTPPDSPGADARTWPLPIQHYRLILRDWSMLPTLKIRDGGGSRRCASIALDESEGRWWIRGLKVLEVRRRGRVPG